MHEVVVKTVQELPLSKGKMIELCTRRSLQTKTSFSIHFSCFVAYFLFLAFTYHYSRWLMGSIPRCLVVPIADLFEPLKSARMRLAVKQYWFPLVLLGGPSSLVHHWKSCLIRLVNVQFRVCVGIEKTWGILERAINEINNHNASGLSFEELYRCGLVGLFLRSVFFVNMNRHHVQDSPFYSLMPLTLF